MLPTLARSIGLFDRGQDLLPGGVSSPGRAFAEVETPPIFLESGEGCHVVDADGNRYMDFIGGLGPLILGHRPPAVQRALEAQLARGTVFATPNALEYALAERILASTPPLERLRFACSGTEAAMTALRIAKAVTGRPKVLKFSGGYHGHADTLLARGAKPHMRGRGCRVHDGLDDAVVQNTIVVSYNDVAGVTAAFRAWGHDVAAVIVEPCATNMGVVRPVPGFLAALREACDAAGALLVFDEVVSGFRFRYGGLGPEVGVEPDLVTFGKIIGGGTPIGAFGGRAHHLEVLRRAGGVFQGGTFAGNPLSMAAGLATLDELAKPGFYEGMERRGCVTEATLLHGFQKHGLPFFVQRKGSLLSLILIEGQKRLGNLDDVQKQDGKLFARFHLRMLEAGFLLPPTIEEPLFISAAHTEDDLVRFATAAARVLADLAAGRP